jgi:hypothetical protein
MSRYTPIVLAAAVALLAACGDNAFAPFEEEEAFDWAGAISPGRTLEIKGISGSVTVVPGAAGETEVHALKRGRDDDPASVDIVVVRHSGGVTICTLYPDVPGAPRNTCEPGPQGHMGSRDNDVQVEFTVKLPAGVHFTGLEVSGDITVDAKADVSATTVSGNVDITTSGNADATTVSGNIELAAGGTAEATAVSGSIDARLGKAHWGRDLAFTAVSGHGTVQVPSNTNAHVVATTASGSVCTDFPLGGTARSREGNIGAGGPRLALTAVSGNVRLRSGPAA